MEERTRAYRIHHRNRVINRKRRLISEIYGRKEGYELFPVDGQLAKGKIHCSCSLCSQKVKRNGWKHSDIKQLLRSRDEVEWEDVQLQYS